VFALGFLASTTAPVPGPEVERGVGYYDEALQRVVLVGGPTNPRHGDRDRVWSWSGTRWDLVTDAGPSSRGNAAAAYDLRRGKAITTGGARSSAKGAQVVGDSWEGDVNGWRQIADIPPRDHHAMVTYGRGAVLMFGGIPADRSAAWPSDTWELGPDGWTRTTTEGPPARGRTALVYDATRKHVVLFGGVSAPESPDQRQTFLNDTWIFENARWRKVADSGPRGRYGHGMVFDEQAKVVLLYSGAGAHKNAPLSDMWKWDGERWTEIRLSGPTPGFRYQPIMVYDRARNRTVLYGGLQGGQDDTWEWDGQRWQEIR
jgi:hypothetical protein